MIFTGKMILERSQASVAKRLERSISVYGVGKKRFFFPPHKRMCVLRDESICHIGAY